LEERLRLLSVRIITSISCLLFGAAAWHLGPHSSSDFTAQAQTVQTATVAAQLPQLKPVSDTTGKVATISEPKLPAGTEIYTAKRGETIPTIARRYLGRTGYLTTSELSDAIRAANHKSDASNILKGNEPLLIPGLLPAPITEKTIPVPRDFEVRAIYLTGIMAASDHGLRIIKHWREVGGNSVVFDIKDSDGSVTIPFEHPLFGKHNVYIHDVPKFVHFLHQQNMHAIARIAIFRDERLVVEHPELAVQSRKNKTAWRENGKLVWTDPSNPKVQDYDIALAKYVAGLGVDEIQFDYVRFPAEGDQKDAQFAYQNGVAEAAQPPQDACADATHGHVVTDALVRPAMAKPSGPSANADTTTQSSSSSPVGTPDNSPTLQRRVAGRKARESRGDAPKSADTACSASATTHAPQRTDVITSFLKKAYAELHPTGVLLSLDVFGVMAWQRPVDLAHTGQDIVGMAHYCDALSPMIYPSHFFGMDNIAHPGDEPAHFIGESMARFELITHPTGDLTTGVVIRPWLQAFHWRTKTYSPEYIKIQVETAKEKGGIGFLFWNAANDYSKPYEAMPEMKSANLKEGSKDKAKYFRGDELPVATTQAALTSTK
jgi:hypothetical protein